MTDQLDFKEFDEVSINRGANVNWLFTDKRSLSGRWTVINVIGNELIISRGESIARIDKKDVTMVSQYSIDAFLEYLKGKSGYGQKETNQGRSRR